MWYQQLLNLVPDCLAVSTGFESKNYLNPKGMFSTKTKNFKKKSGSIVFQHFFFTQLRESWFPNHGHFKKHVFFLGKLIILISTMLLYYTQMKMMNLSLTPENFNPIQEPCGIVGMPAVMAFAGNHLTTGWLCLFDLAWPPDFRDQVNV